MTTKKSNITPLNGTSLAEIPIEELESRLEKEILDPSVEMWTCDDCGEKGCPLINNCQNICNNIC
jgi:hypothetical protein